MAPAQGRSGEDAPQLPGHGVGVANQGEHFAGAGVCIGDQVAPVQGCGVAGAAEVAPVGFGLRVSITAELCDGAAEQVAPGQARQDAPDLPWDGHAVVDEREHLCVARVGVVRKVPRITLGSCEVVGHIEAVAGDGRIYFRSSIIWRECVAYAGADLALGPVLGDVQGIDCPGDHAVHLGLAIGLRPFVVIGEVNASHRRGYEPINLSCGAVVSQRCRYEAVDSCGGAVVCERCCYEAVDLCCGAEGCQCCSDGSIAFATCCASVCVYKLPLCLGFFPVEKQKPFSLKFLGA